MVWCKHCAKNVPKIRPFDGGLACDLCGRILENFNFSTDVTFVKNAAGQVCNIVTSVGNSSSRDRRRRKAIDELRNLKDALGIGDERDDVVDMAAVFYEAAMDQNFTKGRRAELVQSSCLYLACSYLRVSVYELGSVYLQLCEMLYLVQNKNYEELVDPSIFIPRFTNSLLKGAHAKAKDVANTAKNIISSMKRDWIQTGRKPSGICGAAIYMAALSHGIMYSRADIAKVVHMCEATITKRLNEFANTEAGSLTVDELDESEEILRKETFTPRPNSDKGVVNCKHKDLKRFGYGLCKSCHDDFIIISGGVVGGSDPPAYQRAEKERMEKAAREENEGGIGNLNHDEQVNVSKRAKKCSEKGEGETYGGERHAEYSDESDICSDDDDSEVEHVLLGEDETRLKTTAWNLQNKDYLEEQAEKEAALKAANCPEDARNLVEASKAAVANSRKEKRRKRAEEAKNAPPSATATEASYTETQRVNQHHVLDELLDTSPTQKKPRTETVTEKKKEEHEIVEDEEDEEDYAAPHADENFYEDEVEEEENGYDFGLY
ncbi:Cyclin/Brf1-like TBP-binding protein [Arabidopsis thaliana]|uniref:Cyclin/Brf1-like TBP-binding protein n=1 Tax=Arabidopsis thaliana TaxID=3702 RepID=F4IN86_ARATH|nr:Cyclin/Brf1-like TBP-binding protein [Arabidopsis thaliana]AEC05428.1 Cyclin/Brf1-like TBP-binding protein [Arabidopsis thaliana]|eukprot:NP_178237.3 Cyclin/Brf1-like TBP-binding protein [Arabidopsis thaliana]